MSVNIKENGSLSGIAKLIPPSNITLSSLPDTNIVSPQAEQGLGYDEASGRWVNYNVRISVYYSDDFRGLNISCTKGQTTITKTAPMDGNAVVFYVNEKGTWTVSAEIGATSYTDTVDVSSFGVTYPAQLVTSSSQTPEGATVEPTDDIQTWLACANITDKSYTTLEEVLADRATFETLIADSNACDYMARSTTWASNEGLVPILSSAIGSNGQAIEGGHQSSGYDGWKVFDGNSTTSWRAQSSVAWVGYAFNEATVVKKVKIVSSSSSPTTQTIKLQYSTDNGSTWQDASDSVSIAQNTTGYIVATNSPSCTHHRFIITSATGGDYYGYIVDAQFYAKETCVCDDQDAMALIGKYDYCSNALLSNATWAEAIANSDYWDSVLQPLVPVMTSNTTPSGVASAISVYQSSATYQAWKAFDDDSLTVWHSTDTANPWIKYEFPEAIDAKMVQFISSGSGSNSYVKDFKIFGTNVANPSSGDWVELLSATAPNSKGVLQKFALTSTGSYKTYMMQCQGKNYNNTNYCALNTLQFYGRSSNEVLVPLVPTMTSNTTPSGEVLYGNMLAGSQAYLAFDKNESNNTQGNTGTISTFYIGYDFGTPTVVNSLTLKASCYVATYYYKLKPQGYNGSEWVDIGTDELTVQSAMGSPQTLTLNLNNTTAYSKYRLLGTTTNTSGSAVYIVNVTQLYIYELQFYQRTVQTNIVHSCANDTIYYMDEGSPVIVATTNSDGDGILDFSLLEDQIYTFYSSVAKNTGDLTLDYSKRVRITKSEYGGTTEMYLRPDAVSTLYWYGYVDSNLESQTNANGWSYQSMTLRAPTYNTNNITMNSSQGIFDGVATKNPINGSHFSAIAQGVTVYGGCYGFYGSESSKAKNYADYEEFRSNALTKVSHAISSNKYIYFETEQARASTLYAFWYDRVTQHIPTFISASNDSLYILDGATKVYIASTDGEGKSYEPLLEAGTYTIYSSIAKDPSNLSNPYSKTITIDENTQTIVIMPSNVLYWWGYIGDNTENAITANGWSSPQGFTDTSIPTYNANNLYLATTGSYGGGFGTKNKISANTLHSIQKTTVSYGGYPTWCRFEYSNKYTDSSNVSSGYMFTTSDNVMQHLTGTPTQDCYFCWATCQTRAGYLYALWYE